ncbi:MAG: HypC/HybG/HupF family hydrogenase formation chaperone [Candidatus Schekmanbacteria bacterium]|nr:HypC/HybG/HupF family hydrogenase formation chaperone [Candidatus Schekmanbacteria bacterium]
MCLAIPMQVVAIGPDGMGTVELGGVRKEVSLILLDEVSVGDHVIVHVGFALSRLDRDEAEATLQMFAEMAAADSAAGQSIAPRNDAPGTLPS